MLEEDPEQSNPPLRGVGAEHVRCLVNKPSSQESEQLDHEPQDAQLPLTKIGIKQTICVN